MCEHPAGGPDPSSSSIVSEEIFGRPLLKPLHVFPDVFYPNAGVFSGEREMVPPGSKAQSPPTERKSLVMQAQMAFVSNGCAK
ncbi:MAG: hypothetical protein ACXVDN_22615 [Ktedonobacteraceae bacterium]